MARPAAAPALLHLRRPVLDDVGHRRVHVREPVDHVPAVADVHQRILGVAALELPLARLFVLVFALPQVARWRRLGAGLLTRLGRLEFGIVAAIANQPAEIGEKMPLRRQPVFERFHFCRQVRRLRGGTDCQEQQTGRQTNRECFHGYFLIPKQYSVLSKVLM